MMRIIFILATLAVCESVYVYSSFWAPLFNPRILNYRVDLNIDPEGGKSARDEYIQKYGYHGEKLIEDLGNGKGPAKSTGKEEYAAVKFYYTYPGAVNTNNR